MSRNAAMLAKNRATEAELEPGIWEPKDLKNHSFPWDSRESRPSIRLNGSEGHQPAGRVGLGQGASPISTCRAAAELLHDEDCRSVCVRVLPTYEGTFFLGKHGRGPNQGLGRRCAIVSVSNLPGCIFEQCSCAVSLALELELDHPMNFAGVNFKVAAAQGASCFASNGKARTRKKNLQVGLDVFFFGNRILHIMKRCKRAVDGLEEVLDIAFEQSRNNRVGLYGCQIPVVQQLLALTSSRRMNTRDSSSLRVNTRRKGRFPLLSCCQAHYTGELSLSGSS